MIFCDPVKGCDQKHFNHNRLLTRVARLAYPGRGWDIETSATLQRKSDKTMKHLNPYRFYELAAKLYGLFGTNQNRVADMFGPLTEAQAVLDGLIKGDPVALETSKPDALRLLEKIGNIFNKYYIDPSSKQIRSTTGEDRIDSHEMAMLRATVEKFEHALGADLNRAPTFSAGKRGIYSTYDLIQNAYMTFPGFVLEVIPQSAKDEFNTAGRALAFGLGTGAAMHLLRAVEIVLKQYYELYSGTEVAKTERNYSIYLKKLAALAEDEGNAYKPDKRLLQMLAQIKEHYRNPLIAPESSVSTEQATSLFGLACAVITLMVEQILAYKPCGDKKDAKPTTEAVAAPEAKKETSIENAKEALADVVSDATDEDDTAEAPAPAPTGKTRGDKKTAKAS